MKKYQIAIGTMMFFALAGCLSAIKPFTYDFNRSSRQASDVYLDRTNLYKLIVQSGVSKPHHSIVHLSHTCNLVIDNQRYPVIDMRELIKAAMVPRGVNQILVFNPGQQLVQKIEYGQARPLFCEDNKLYLYDDLILDGQSNEGNVLEFKDAGFKLTIFNEDLNKNLPLKNNLKEVNNRGSVFPLEKGRRLADLYSMVINSGPRPQ